MWRKLALIFLVWMAGSVSVQAERFRSWTDMCQSRPCGTFPIDHVVVMFGDKRYDFPMRRLTLPDWYAQMRQRQVPERVRYNWSAPGTPPRRGFSYTGFSIGACCDEMFAWFGVTRPNQSALLQTGAQGRVHFYPYPRDPRRVKPRYRLEYWLYGTETMYQPAIGPDDIPEHLRIDATPDFWRLPDHFGDLVLVSKKPMIAGGHVLAVCRGLGTCSFHTLRRDAGTPMPDLLVDAQVTTRIGAEFTFDPVTKEKINISAGRFATYLRGIDEMLRRAEYKPQ